MFALWVNQITIGDAVVGGGTIALALVTVYLGVETRATARAARESLESAEEPFVIATPTDAVETMTLRAHETQAIQNRQPPPPFVIHRSHNDGQDSRHFVRMRLWNTGMGPAIVNGVELLTYEGPLAVSEAQYPLPIGAIVDIEVDSGKWTSDGDAELRISYSHADGRDYTTASIAEVRGNLVYCVSYERARSGGDDGSLRRLSFRLRRRRIGRPQKRT